MRLHQFNLVCVFVATVVLTACSGSDSGSSPTGGEMSGGQSGSGSSGGEMSGGQSGGDMSGGQPTETVLLRKWRAYAAGNPTLDLSLRERRAHWNRIARRATHATGAYYEVENGQWTASGPFATTWEQTDLYTLPSNGPIPGFQSAAVLEHNGITVLKYDYLEAGAHVAEGPERDIIQSETYVGFLEYGSFWNSFGVTCYGPTLNSCDNVPADELDISFSLDAYGQRSARNPGGTGSASWSGMMIGADLSSYQSREALYVVGDARVQIDDLANPDVNVSFTGIREVDTGASRPDMVWNDLALTNGTFNDGGGGTSTISGGFVGGAQQEVVGVFERDNVSGSFGAKRQ